LSFQTYLISELVLPLKKPKKLHVRRFTPLIYFTEKYHNSRFPYLPSLTGLPNIAFL